MCLSTINLPNLCPNMNHFDAVDFSECHSEEAIVSFDAQCTCMVETLFSSAGIKVLGIEVLGIKVLGINSTFRKSTWL